MQRQPEISCICLSYRRPAQLENAIKCFLAQTYSSKELIIVGHGDDPETRIMAASFNAGNIKFVEAPALSRGQLRNLAVRQASGEYVCQWDDDDWYHARRLEVQFQQMEANGKHASVLAYWLMLDKVNKKAYLSFPSALGRSLLYNKALFDLGIRYSDTSKNEEMDFLAKIHAVQCPYPVVMPHLYIYIYHGANMHKADYFVLLYRQSQQLADHIHTTIENAIESSFSGSDGSEILSQPELLGEFDYFMNTGSSQLEYEDISIYLERFPTKVVLNGPFKGLQYPGFKSAGSAILPKLIGSYEYEIASVIDEIIHYSYDTILDIGCAEGYYAVGLALACPRARIFAFDIDEKAREMCLKMAQLNEVADRVSVHGSCTQEMLVTFPFTGKSLIICDCEGFEIALFTTHNLSSFAYCDLLIETHDFVNITISTHLEKLFGNTHDLISVKSIDDVQKAKTYSFYPFQDLADLGARKTVYAEGRPAIMEWLWIKSKRLHCSNS